MLNDIVSNIFILIFHVAFSDHLYILLIKIVFVKIWWINAKYLQ